jgi:hypothetical protein
MLSLRSLAFILYSAIRRARALSSAALHRFPDRTKALIIGRSMLTNMIASMLATNSKSRRSMRSLLRSVYTSTKAITARGAKDPFGWGHGLFPWIV